MIRIADYIEGADAVIGPAAALAPWMLCEYLPGLVEERLRQSTEGYWVKDNVAIHLSATIEEGAVLKGPIWIGPDCFVAAHAYLRAGVLLLEGVKIGPGVELKSSLLFPKSAVAHFNFIGDSIVGREVNFEAGAVIANHYNELSDKTIYVRRGSDRIFTNTTKFGALVGDRSKIGANAVLSPGTLLPPNSIVKRLELV